MTWRIIYFRVNKYRKSYKWRGENWLETAPITLRKIQPREKTSTEWHMLFNFTHGFPCHGSHLRELLNLSWTIFLLKLTESAISFLYLPLKNFFRSKNIFKLTNVNITVSSAVHTLPQGVNDNSNLGFPCLIDDKWTLMTVKQLYNLQLLSDSMNIKGNLHKLLLL